MSAPPRGDGAAGVDLAVRPRGTCHRPGHGCRARDPHGRAGDPDRHSDQASESAGLQAFSRALGDSDDAHGIELRVGATHPMSITVLIVLLVIACSVWVYFDARRYDWTNDSPRSPGGWAV